MTCSAWGVLVTAVFSMACILPFFLSSLLPTSISEDKDVDHAGDCDDDDCDDAWDGSHDLGRSC